MNANRANINSECQSNNINQEAVYAEMYNEMRRFRDYEFTSSMWYTSILLALIGFVVSTRFAQPTEGLAKFIEDNLWMKIIIAAIAVLLGAASTYLIYYTCSRYDHLREWTDDNLEPEWKKYRAKNIPFKPRHIYYITQIVLVVTVLILLFIEI
jgi:membrane protein YqaA with SNARE-associated domain